MNLLILAAGMSSRMKQAAEGLDIDEKLLQQAQNLPKGMIGVGKNGRPFLDYQLFNAAQGGFKNVCLLLNPKDTVTKPYYEKLEADGKSWGLHFDFAVQQIPPDRIKPLGTADAVEQALRQMSAWKGQRFVACNSDNLYSSNVFKLMVNSPQPNCMIGYDADGLGFDHAKVQNCAVLFLDEEGYLENLIEKPTDDEIAEAKARTGQVRISMNIFGFDYDTALNYMHTQPLHPTRNEKEMPSAVARIAQENAKTVWAIPVYELMPDLTSKADLNEVKTYLEQIPID
jgi:glucose-1-phosphate adenylyltransferase